MTDISSETAVNKSRTFSVSEYSPIVSSLAVSWLVCWSVRPAPDSPSMWR